MAGKTRPKLFLMGMDERNNLFSRCSMCCTNACEKKKKEIVYSSLRRKYRDEISEQGKLVKIFEKRMDFILERDAIEEF